MRRQQKNAGGLLTSWSKRSASEQREKEEKELTKYARNFRKLAPNRVGWLRRRT